MRCAEIQPNLAAFVLGGLEPEEAAEVRSHLASCPSCHDEVRELQKVNRALEATPPHADPLPTSRTKSFLAFALRDFLLPTRSRRMSRRLWKNRQDLSGLLASTASRSSALFCRAQQQRPSSPWSPSESSSASCERSPR